MIFLISPYSHDDPTVRVEWIRLARSCVCWGLLQGYPVFSPWSYGHQFLRALPELQSNASLWHDLFAPMLKASDTVWLLMLDGWDENPGAMAQFVQAHLRKKTMTYIKYSDGDFSFEEG